MFIQGSAPLHCDRPQAMAATRVMPHENAMATMSMNCRLPVEYADTACPHEVPCMLPLEGEASWRFLQARMSQ
jgi:hypothetical protein